MDNLRIDWLQIRADLGNQAMPLLDFASVRPSGGLILFYSLGFPPFVQERCCLASASINAPDWPGLSHVPTLDLISVAIGMMMASLDTYHFSIA